MSLAFGYSQAINENEKASQILKNLIETQTIWIEKIYLRYAECCHRLEDFSTAFDYYEKAVKYQFDEEDIQVDPEIVLKCLKLEEAKRRTAWN